MKIPGIVPVRRRALLTVFGSLQGVREASLEQIAAVAGFNDMVARKVLSALGVEVTSADISTGDSGG